MDGQNKKSFVRLIHQNMGIINSVCHMYYAHSGDREDARQDVILELWKSLPQFRGASKASTWIYRVALNTLIKKSTRERKKHHYVPLEEIAYMPPQVDDDTLLLKWMIGQLQPEDKALIILYLEGYSHKEIGTLIDLSPTNVGTRINRIKTKLKSLFKSTNHEYRSI